MIASSCHSHGRSTLSWTDIRIFIMWGCEAFSVLTVKLFANQSVIVATSPKFEYQIDSLPRNYKGRQKMYGIVLHCQNFLSSSPSQQQQLFKWKPEIDRQYKPEEKTGALRDKYNIAPGFLFTSNTLLGLEHTGGRNVRVKVAWSEISSDHSKIFWVCDSKNLIYYCICFLPHNFNVFLMCPGD